MVKSSLRKLGRKFPQTALKMSFELDCARCDKKYLRRHASSHGCEFVPKDDSSCRAFDIRALVGHKSSKKRKRRCWTPSHAHMLRIILDVFGGSYLPVAALAFEHSEEMLQRKAAEILAERAPSPAPSPAPTPAPAKATPAAREELKHTPNLSTADKHWQPTPRFTPRLGQISCPEVLRFTPDPYHALSVRLGGGESMIYNPLSGYNTCKFPDITGDNLWEEKHYEAKADSRWEYGAFPSPMVRHSSMVSPLMVSVKATPMAGMSFLHRVTKPVIERL